MLLTATVRVQVGIGTGAGEITFVEIENYDNDQRVFRGKANVKGDDELVNGTYFYSFETDNGIKLNGFLILKK